MLRDADIDSDLVPFELEALSRLLHLWARGSVEARRRQWPLKLEAFRRGVIAGTGSGQKRWPRELIADEYAVMFGVVEREKGRLVNGPRQARASTIAATPIVVELASDGKRGKWLLKRPFPAPRSLIRQLCGEGTSAEQHTRWSSSPAVIARELVAARLGVTASGVKALVAPGAPSPRMDTTPAQQQLVSVFFDLRSTPPTKRIRVLQGRILDALFLSGYHALGLYYLAQHAHSGREREPVFSGSIDFEAVEALCDRLGRPTSGDHASFVSLVSGRLRSLPT